MPLKVLVADDSITIQRVLELSFNPNQGVEVRCVDEGHRAIEIAREWEPSVIFCDIIMPGKNGYEVCATLKADPRTQKIPIFLMSGIFEPFDGERAERAGADLILKKPLKRKALYSAMNRFFPEANLTPPPESEMGCLTLLFKMIFRR